MTVILKLNPEMEKGLMARAQARGVSLDDYIQELVAREAGLPAAPEPPPAGKQFDNLSDFLLNSPFARASPSPACTILLTCSWVKGFCCAFSGHTRIVRMRTMRMVTNGRRDMGTFRKRGSQFRRVKN